MFSHVRVHRKLGLVRDGLVAMEVAEEQKLAFEQEQEQVQQEPPNLFKKVLQELEKSPPVLKKVEKFSELRSSLLLFKKWEEAGMAEDEARTAAQKAAAKASYEKKLAQQHWQQQCNKEAQKPENDVRDVRLSRAHQWFMKGQDNHAKHEEHKHERDRARSNVKMALVNENLGDYSLNRKCR